MSIGTVLTGFIQTHLAGDERALAVDENTPLIDGGVIDSMGLMQLIGFIEEQFAIRIPDEEVMPENFQTVRSMQRLITRLKSRRTSESQ